MPHDTLDERLRRYYDEIPTLDVPLDHAAPMARARQRRRHQLTGLVAATVLVIAGLGAYARTLLEHDERSSGPVAVEGDEGSSHIGVGSQRWIVSPITYEGVASTWEFVHVVDGESSVGLVRHVGTGDRPVANGPTAPLEVWRIDGTGHEVVATGLDQVDGMTMLDEELWVAGVRDDEIAFAVSSDDGITWSVQQTDAPYEPDRTDVTVAAGDGFVTLSSPHLNPETGLLTTRVVTYVVAAGELTETEHPGITRVTSVDGGVVMTLEGGTTHLMTSDGKEWFELDAAGDEAFWTGRIGRRDVWLSADDDLVVGDTTTPLDELVGRDVQFHTSASGPGRLALLVTTVEGPREQFVLVTSDGTEWTVLTLSDPPEQSSMATEFISEKVFVDADGTVVVTGRLVRDRARVNTPAALILDPDGTSPPSSRDDATADRSDMAERVGRGAHHWIDAPPGAATGELTAVGTSTGLIALWGDDGELWRWDGGWEQLEVDGVRSLDRSGTHLALLTGGGSDDGGAVVRLSVDGGATWEATELPIDAHDFAFARTLGEDWVAVAPSDGRAVRTYRLDPEPVEHGVVSMRDGVYVLDEVDGSLWAWEYPLRTTRRAPVRIRTGPYLHDEVDIPVGSIVVAQGATWLGDTTLWLEGEGSSTRIRTSGGVDLAVDELVDAEGFDEMYVNGVRSWAHGFVVLATLHDDDGHHFVLLTSDDGERWGTRDVAIPNGTTVNPESVRLLDVDESGAALIDPGTDDPMLAFIQPEGSENVTPAARAAADAFVAAWRDGDRRSMLELVDDASVVDNALAIASPSGQITRCSRQVNGQFECFVATTDTYEAYIQVGPPGAPDDVVAWVGPVAH